MTAAPDQRRSLALLVAALCAAVMAVEFYLLFVNRVETFRITGDRSFEVSEFAGGATLSHAFLMRGDGLQSVSVLFNSRGAARARVHWSLWRGYPDVPSQMTLAFEQVHDLELKAGRQWRSLTVPRDGLSNDRWYTIRVRLVESGPASALPVTLVASPDNPDRGGVFWINDLRQPGSLWMSAERRGRTLYRRFRADAEPHLPPMLRVPVVQWGIVLGWHWAVCVFVYAILLESRARDAT